MDLNEKIENAFKPQDTVYSPRDTNSSLELKKIEQQLNNHLKKKNKQKHQRVNLYQNIGKSYDEPSFNILIDQEIAEKTTKKTWRSLPMFLKWKLLQDYMTNNNLTNIADIKSRLLDNSLEVEYVDQKVTKIF